MSCGLRTGTHLCLRGAGGHHLSGSVPPHKEWRSWAKASLRAGPAGSAGCGEAGVITCSDEVEFAIFCTTMKFWPRAKLLEVGHQTYGRELQAIQRELKFREDNRVSV